MKAVLSYAVSVFVVLFALSLVFCGSSSGVDLNQTYSNDSDFDEGVLVGVEHNTTSDELQLSDSSESAFSFIWVP